MREAYRIKTLQAKAALACWQYPIRLLSCATEHDLVMYHGGPGWGRLGSLISELAW